MGQQLSAKLFYGVWWEIGEEPEFPDLDEVVEGMLKEAGVKKAPFPDMNGLTGDSYRVAWRRWDESPERVAHKEARAAAVKEIGCEFGSFGNLYNDGGSGSCLYALGSVTEADWGPQRVQFDEFFDEMLADIKIKRIVDRYGLTQPTDGPDWFMAPLVS